LINKARFGSDFNDDKRVPDLERLERIISGKPKNAQEKELCAFTSRRVPIHWGGQSEPFASFDEEFKIGLQALKIFEKYEYPFIVSTKNHRIVEGEYWETLKRCKYKVVQVSLITDRPELNKIEPNPEIAVERRLDIIEKCAKEGIRVVVRLQPFIPKFCEKGIEEFIERMGKLGAKAMTIEYLKLPAMMRPELKVAINKLADLLGYDVIKFYKVYGKKTATDYEIKPEIKKLWIKRVRDLVHKNGMEFYCADNDFRGLGDNAICCGVGNEEGFQNRNETRTGRIFELGKSLITIEDFDKGFLEEVSGVWLNQGTAEKSRKTKNMSLRDYFMSAWDNVRSPLSPCKFYANVKFAGKDKNGHNTYRVITIK